jgi:alpha-galactosidase
MPIAAIDDVVVSNGHGRIYPEGWQSWSPTTTYALGQTPHRPDHSGQQTMRFRPEAPMPSHGFQAEGLLVLDPGTGEPIRSYSGPDALRTVPSIRAYLDGSRLVVTADAPVQTAHGADSIDAALAGFRPRAPRR